jgi:CheY-like chemotaxis protein
VQVFVNLLVNAAHAIAPGAPEANEVRVTTRKDEHHAIVCITDTGVGIPAENLQRLFDPFFTTKPSGVGTGLGLTICQKVIADLGGRISVDSIMGGGSTFRIELPLATVAREEPAARPRILLVDDDALVGRALTRLLRAEYEVVYRQHAREALQLLERGERFDVMLCDIVMPGMNGMELYDAVRERAPDMLGRIVFLSGATHVAAAREFLLGIPNEFLEKPVDQAALTAALARKARA